MESYPKGRIAISERPASMAAIAPRRKINFFGIVHACGGCGSEALGAVELLRSKGVSVRMIVPPSDPIIDRGNAAADYLRAIGVELAQYRPGLFNDCGVIVCLGEKKMFDLIREYNDRPRYIVYSDCMGTETDIEVEAHKDGLVDEFLFQSKRHADAVGPAIARRAHKAVTVRSGYKAFINTNSPYFPIRFKQDKPTDVFTAIKAGRDDADKWHPDTWRMFCGISAPNPTKVQVEIAGWGENASDKVGNPCLDGNMWRNQFNVTLHEHNHDVKWMSELYARSHVLVHILDYNCEEALGRVILEAQASGVVAITDKRGGPIDLIEHGATGFLCDAPDEASFYASECAFHDGLRRSIASQAYTRLVTEGHGSPESCWPWWADLLGKA